MTEGAADDGRPAGGPGDELLVVLDLCRAAGQAILARYGSPLEVERKADASPLTLADRASHDLLSRRLARAFPGVPVVSEEGDEGAGPAPPGGARFWLVDPLDGTKEFIKGTGEFTVNVALVEEGRAVLGVVYVPVSGVAYLARAGTGAWRLAPGATAVPLRTREADPERLVVAASRDHAGPLVRRLLDGIPGARTVSMGSSLKFCLVAEGTADLYVRDGPTMEWDTAAAQCVVEAAGGALLELESGRPLTYGKETLRNPHLVTVGDPELDWRGLLPA